MNNVLELRGKRFIQADKTVNGGGAAMNSKVEVTVEHLQRLKSQLKNIKEFWEEENKFFDGVLVSVFYNKIVAKSNRICGLFKGKNSNESIVGAKFNQERNKHIITYYVSVKDLEKSIYLLSNVADILEKRFFGKINQEIFQNKDIINSKVFKDVPISMSSFKNVIADVSFIEDFRVEQPDFDNRQSIITLYDVNREPKELFEELGINLLSSRILDKQTVFLDKKQIEILLEKAPYLVSMATVNLTKLSPDDFISNYQIMYL